MLAVLSVFGRHCFGYHEGIMPVKSIVSALFLLTAISVASAGQASPNPKEQISQDEQKAQQYLREKRPDLAIPELKKIVVLDPGNVQARANLGVLLFFKGDYGNSLPQLRAATNLQPDLWKVRSLLGIAEERTSDFDGARKDLEASFPMIEEQKLKIEVGLDLIGLYAASSNLQLAANIVGQLKTAYPDDPEVLYAAYRTYADLSGESMLSLSLVAPDSAQMHQLLAHEEIREGNTNAAVAEFRKAIALNGNLPGVHFELAELLNTSQDPAVKKEAKQEYLAALASDPQDEKAIYRLGEIAAQEGNTQMAFDEYTKAVALQPTDSDAKLALAKALIEMNQPEKAQALLEQTVQLDPTNATAHYRLAAFYRQQGRIEDAKQQLEIYQGLRKKKTS